VLSRRLWVGLSILTNSLAAAALGCAFLWWAFGKALCGDDYVGAPLPAPPPAQPHYFDSVPLDRDYAAYVWSRECGATTSFNTKVFVARPQPHWPDPREAVFETNLPPRDLRLHWESHTELVIEYPPPPQRAPYIQKSVSKWYDITITLQPSAQ